MPPLPPWIAPLVDHPLRREILRVSDAGPCYLVGGAIRDARVFGRTEAEWDLIVSEAEDVARRLALVMGGTAIHLGGERFGLHRVVAGTTRIDLQAPLEPTLEAELRRRDLTVNAIALELRDARLEDPTGGCDDLERGVLRQCSERTFVDDPLRVLRLVRFASTMPGFAVEPITLAAARTEAGRLVTVARERIREELRKILSGRPRRGLADLLTGLRLHPGLWRGAGSSDLWPPTESADSAGEKPDLDALDEILGLVEKEMARATSAEDLEALRHAALLLAACGPDEAATARGLVARGMVSIAVGRRIDDLLTPVPIPRDEADRRLYLYRFGPAWPFAVTLQLWTAVRREAGGESSGEGDARAWREALTELVATRNAVGDAIFDLRSPLDGDELQRMLGLRPGPRLGKLIEHLRTARIEGRIESRDDALAWARRWLETEGARERPDDRG